MEGRSDITVSSKIKEKRRFALVLVNQHNLTAVSLRIF